MLLHILQYIEQTWPVMEAQTFNPSIEQAEVGGSPSSRPDKLRPCLKNTKQKPQRLTLLIVNSTKTE